MPKRPGKPEAGRRSERPVSLRRARYCPNGAWPSPPSLLTDDLRSLDAGVKRRGHERRSWPLSRTPKTGRFAGRTAKGSHDPRPLGAAMRSSGYYKRRQVLPQRGHGLSPTTTAGLTAKGCRPKGGPRSASWPPSWLPGSGLFAREKVRGPSFTQDSSLIDRLTPRARPRERRPTYLCPTQPPTPAQPS